MRERKPQAAATAEEGVRDPEASMREGAHLPLWGRLANWLGRPVLFVPLLVCSGFIGGYVVGAVRLTAREREWDARRGELERSLSALESSLRDAKTQEVSYRVLVSVSRAVVDLYDRNFGLAAQDIRDARQALASVPQAAGSEIAGKLEAFEARMEEVSRHVEEISRTARDTVRELEREVTRSLFAAGS